MLKKEYIIGLIIGAFLYLFIAMSFPLSYKMRVMLGMVLLVLYLCFIGFRRICRKA